MNAPSRADNMSNEQQHKPAEGLQGLGVRSLLRRDGGPDHRHDSFFLQIIQDLPAAIYVTDSEGRITFYNEAAAHLWGRNPKLGEDLWCGSWRLFWPDGRPMAHDECPMAITLRTGKAVRGIEAVAERPDGTHYSFIPYPTPLFDVHGKLVGAVNMLVDNSERRNVQNMAQRLAAIVKSSDDAIVSKSLDGIITSWNAGAERIFGYTVEEIIGKPITTIIPRERLAEEPDILSRILRGERIEHYETLRRRKDGSLLNVSLTVSPIKNSEGRIVGASKIARDITERKQAAETQELLINEIQHRVKNTLSMVQAIAAQTFRTAPEGERQSFNSRLQALAAAHDLLTHHNWDVTAVRDLIERVLAPFRERNSDRIRIAGPNAALDVRKSLSLAMALHELGTNAVKYGALSNDHGHVNLNWELAEDRNGKWLKFLWKESGGPPVQPPGPKGFGSVLIERALETDNGKAQVEYLPSGLKCLLEIRL